MPSPLVALIEDDQGVLQMLDLLLRDAGYRVTMCSLGKDAHDFVLHTMPDVIVLDLWLEDADAGGMVLGLLELDPMTRHIPVIICSAHLTARRELAVYLQDKGYRIMEKPFQPDLLLAYIQDAVENVTSGAHLQPHVRLRGH